ncbi:ATP-binding protein [Stieleria marina]|uniref:histidine kinase n=1 Tax=Stieleria marina TaxID=1930275 RepID=A0A517NSJ5_9BACT|nr:Sensor protein FixL [Planctomycetes bacterium K23_9]
MAFVDMRMPPGWDGLKTIAELWKVDPELQVVICSAYSDQSWSKIRQSLGASDRLLILKKPFDSAEVSQVATAMTEKRHLSKLAKEQTEALKLLVEERTQHWQQAKDESQHLLSAIDTMLIGLNEDGQVSRWNRRAAELYGLTWEEVAGRKMSELPIKWCKSFDRRIFLDSTSKRLETSFIDQDGNRRIIGLSNYPVMNGANRNGLLILGADLTETRALEAHLQWAQKLESVGQLAAGVAHEINTPMQYIGDNPDYIRDQIGSLETMVDSLRRIENCDTDIDTETEITQAKIKDVLAGVSDLQNNLVLTKVLEAIGDSRDGVRHVSTIVRAMKEFAHPGQSEKALVDVNHLLENAVSISTSEWRYVATIDLDLDPSLPKIEALAVEPKELFEDALRMADSDLDNVGIIIETDFAAVPPIQTQKHDVLQILVNLIGNAKQALQSSNADRKSIRLMISSDQDSLRMDVVDTGVGIPPENLSKLFQHGFTTKQDGHGFGLHSCAIAAQKLGGSLSVDSDGVGKGAMFSLKLPTVKDSAPESSRRHPQETAADTLAGNELDPLRYQLPRTHADNDSLREHTVRPFHLRQRTCLAIAMPNGNSETTFPIAQRQRRCR